MVDLDPSTKNPIFDKSEESPWQPGDLIGIFPPNCSELVARILSRWGLIDNHLLCSSSLLSENTNNLLHHLKSTTDPEDHFEVTAQVLAWNHLNKLIYARKHLVVSISYTKSEELRQRQKKKKVVASHGRMCKCQERELIFQIIPTT